MKKDYSSLEIGDVVWAYHSKIGKHLFIIVSLNSEKDYECLPAINLSSNCSKCEDCCIDLNEVDIPKDWFEIKKEVSYLRIDNPVCLNRKSYRNEDYSYKGNLMQNYSALFNKICSYNSTVVRQVCSCKVKYAI